LRAGSVRTPRLFHQRIPTPRESPRYPWPTRPGGRLSSGLTLGSAVGPVPSL
jgi:hypothetical protein